MDVLQWTLELAPLASQHHMSDYNRLKYGHRGIRSAIVSSRSPTAAKGSPVEYVPLSIHLPDVVRTLRERQQEYADQPLWWPCGHSATNPVIPAAKQRAALAAGEEITHLDLQHQLSIAISESITLQPQHQTDTRSSAIHVKTSETHPINVSQVIPPESLIAISSQLIPCKTPYPVLFEIRLPYPDLITQYPRVPTSTLSPSPKHKRLSSNELRSPVAGPLNTALNSRIPFSSLQVPSPKFLLSLKRTLKGHPITDGESERNTPDTVPRPTLRRSTVSSAQPAPQTSHRRFPSVLTLPTIYALHPFSPHARLPPPSPSSSKPSKFRLSKPSSTGQGAVNIRPLRLGNLLLSSCPGKKVRLSGPVRGRSAICRDLDVDLRRMKMLGARCVVCCLDDEELEFLIGASWIEYCQIAHREGLDVLRVPLPEGLAPLSPQALDADLKRIIERYTLQGVSVLAHCRGGVGRAGLFACCWMLKLGLCGWVDIDVVSSATTMCVSETKRDDDSVTFHWDSKTVVRRDTLQMVERVIEVIRRRRSVKAIETLEQVQFLVEYVDYLRACGRAGGDLCDSPLPS